MCLTRTWVKKKTTVGIFLNHDTSNIKIQLFLPCIQIPKEVLKQDTCHTLCPCYSWVSSPMCLWHPPFLTFVSSYMTGWCDTENIFTSNTLQVSVLELFLHRNSNQFWMNFMNEKQRWHPHLACEWVWELAPLVTCTRSISLSLSPVALFSGWAEQTATHSSSSSGRVFISAGLPRLCLLLMPCSLPGFFWVHSPEPSFYRLTLFRLLADWLMMAVIQIAAGPPPKTPNPKWDDTYSFTNFSHRSQICKSK